ncbi:MAG: PAS domain S-box protein, partial [Proteobacteria bacterium]|nr:PAS domain S-box protein [Pseudomonadota bacterium]
MVSIILVEAVILVPSYKGYERDLLSKLRESGRATVTSGFKKYGDDSQRDLPLMGRLLTNDSYLRGGALYRPDGGLFARFGERPRLTPGLAESKSITTWRQGDGARLDVIWRPQQTGLPFTVIGRLDSSWIGGELVKFVLRISGLVLIISLFVSGATMLVLRKMILVPLLRLRASLIAASKDPDNPERYTLDLKRNDEFGDVVESFNNLLQLISHSLRSALAEKSALLETTFQSMGQGIVVYDRDLKVIAFNQKFEDLCGFPPGFLHLGTSFEEIVRFRAERGDYGPPTDIEAMVRERARIRRRGDPARRELIGQDGTEVVVSRDTMPNGGFVTTFTDITEIKRAEEALRESEARFRALVDNSPTKIHIKDAEGRYTLVNPLAEKLFGFTDEEARGKTSYDIFPKEIADAFTAHDRQVVESGEMAEQVEQFTVGDEVRTYLTVKFPIPDGRGGVAGIAAIGTDITERKQVEEALRASQERLAGILDIANDAVISIDDSHRITLFNHGAEMAFGYRAEEVLGEALEMLLPLEFREDHRNHIEEFA